MKKRFICVLVAVIVVLVAILFFLWKTGVVSNAIAKDIYNDLNSSKITYEEAKNKLNLLGKVGDIGWVYEECDKLNSSQCSYRNAVELQDKKDYEAAIYEYVKVIQDDLNYEKSKKTIEEIKPLAYDNIISTLDEYLKNENYTDAFKVIENAEKIFENDEKINSFKVSFDEIKEQLDFEKEIASCDLSAEDGIKHYVELKYATLKNTPFGDWNFTVNAHEFNDKSISLDYSVELFLDIDSSKFYDFIYSRDYSEDDRQKTEQMLKNHIITLAQDLIEKLPNKKLEGRYKVLRSIYNDSGEFVKVSRSDCYYEWTNYVYDINADYASSSPSGFRWKWTDPNAPWHYETFFYGGAK